MLILIPLASVLKGGFAAQLGHYRGGLTTKLHLRCNVVGLPVGKVLTEGEDPMTARRNNASMEQHDSIPV